MSNKKTEEQSKAELQARIKGFNEELMPLLGKYKLGLGAQPVLLPSKELALGYVVAAKPILFDDSKPVEIEKEVAAKEVEDAEPPGEKVEGEIAKPQE